ncbi:MAG: A/G-specific adenine glycosylase [Cyclobacteriaceae bacterium]
MNAKKFSEKLINWYHSHHRPLPWRTTSDPYKIWLSEIILQQTRVAQGLPYYQSFVAAFPTVKALAAAREQKVLRLWQGLGYYSRARNLHACARHVASQLNGVFPGTYHDLLKLPGIGPYTAAAIASFAFDQPVAVADGNVFRTLARIFGIDTDIGTAAGKEVFLAKANQLLDKKRPGLFNQAIMEFGAIHCKPIAPGCDDCIFKKQCLARAQNLVHLLPVKSGKRKPKRRHFTYLVFHRDGKLAMKQRLEKDIWKGLYDFPLIELTPRKAMKWIAKNEPTIKVSTQNIVLQAKHVLTHQVIEATFLGINSPHGLNNFNKKAIRFFTLRQVHKLPKPTLITRFLAKSDILE